MAGVTNWTAILAATNGAGTFPAPLISITEGFYTAGMSGGAICGSSTPATALVNGFTLAAFAWDQFGANYHHIMVAVAGTAVQTDLTSVAFTDTTSTLQTLVTASATAFSTILISGYSVWYWTQTEPVPVNNASLSVTVVAPAPPPPPNVPPSATGGQTLSPNRNVIAPAGFGGDIWGANGGGVTPYNTDPQVLVALSDCGLPANYLLNGGGSPNPNSAEVASSMSDAALLGTTLTSALPFNGSNAG